MQSLTRSMAAELGPHGIRVNMVSPGLVETESISGSLRTASQSPGDADSAAAACFPRRHCRGRCGLCTSAGDFVTGVGNSRLRRTSRCNRAFPDDPNQHQTICANKLTRCSAKGRWAEAHARLGDLWRHEGKAGVAGYVISCYDRMKGQLTARELPDQLSAVDDGRAADADSAQRRAGCGHRPDNSSRPVQFLRAGNSGSEQPAVFL